MSQTAAVLGSPISHSLSPTIHNYLYGKFKLDFEYIAVELQEHEFEKWMRSALTETQQWFGFSLTMPLKESVCSPELSDVLTVDGDARRIASANTIYRQKERWNALSTDLLAFQYLLSKYSFNSVLIVGAGATARAAVSALDKLSFGKQYRVEALRRDNKRDDKLLEAAGNLQVGLKDLSGFQKWESFDLVINTVPNDGVIELAQKFPGSGVLLDAIYSPWPPALTAAQLKNAQPVISGLELLTAQALYQFQLMAGLDFDFHTLFLEVLEVLKRNR